MVESNMLTGKTWVRYRNGNYMVSINLKDGTKIRANNLDHFTPDFPESMDLKITDYCDMNCPMCHENSSIRGKHGRIMELEFIDKLHPGTELAIGGGNPLEHPDILPFLVKCKKLNLIPSMTVNQKHFEDNLEILKHMVENNLIYGLGISLTSPTDKFIEKLADFPNAVIHVIAGLVSIRDLEKLSNKGLKILILGYKQFSRGKTLFDINSHVITDEIRDLSYKLPTIIKEGWFEVVSFDNLAIQQLEPRRILTKEQYDEFYMGDDGFATMYVDAVKEEFARSSTSTDRYPIKDNIKDMFEVIRT